MIKVALAVVWVGAGLSGQTFDAASVKLGDPDGRGTSVHTGTGTITATGITARNCVTLAYNLLPFQLEGGPRWIGDLRFNIDAKLPVGSVKGPDDPERMPKIRAAMQALLAERFQLVVHKETKVVPAYVLTAAKGGVKLKASAEEALGWDMNSNQGKLTAKRIPMSEVARYLAGNLGSPVVDMTGLKGVFDLMLEWTPDSKDGSEVPVGPSIFTALEEQLGLKLEKQKAPVEITVIDRIEKPTEN